MKKKFLWFLAIAYALWMVWLLFGQRLGFVVEGSYWQLLKENLNLIPTDTVRRYLWILQHSDIPGQLRHAVINLAGNVIMFVPLGFFLPALWHNLGKMWRFLPLTVVIISIIELIQLFAMLGSCDVDDLMLNVAGACIGWFFWRLLPQKRK